MDQYSRNLFSRFGGFELSLRDRANPLGVDTLGIFSRWGEPVPCLPMIWVYGSGDPMPMALPLVMIEFPIPKDTLEGPSYFKTFDQCQKEQIDVWMLVHASPKRAPCQKASHELAGEVKLDEVNLSHHAWVFDNLDEALTDRPDLSIKTEVQTGIFRAHGASPVHQDLTCVESRGLPFGCMEPREVVVHGGGCFSPCNNMLQLDSSYIFHSFVSRSLGQRCKAEEIEEGGVSRGAIILHIVPAHTEAEQHIRNFTRDATSLVDICAALHVLDIDASNAFDEMLRVFAPDIATAIQTVSKQRQEECRSMISGDPSWGVLKPWCPPCKDVGDRGEGTSVDIVALALQMIDLGCPDFDMNMEVLASVDGNLEAALQFLAPCEPT